MSEPIKIELQLDGEKQFNQALKSVNGELKNMQSAVKATDAANKGAANTEKALTEKVKALGDASATSGKKVKTLEDIVKKQKQAQLDAAKAIDEVKAKFGEGSKEVEKAENAYRIATDSVNKWETKLNEARVEYAGINAELSKNEGYLEEAKNATDKTASSIDEYGKELKDAGKNTSDLTASTVGQVGAMEAFDKISKTLSNTLGKVGDAALDAAKELDKGYDTIAKKTGATGSTLEEFKDVANNIAGSLPESMDDVGKAVGEVNTRFKQTGEQLQKTSTQFVKFAKINEVDVSDSIDDVQKAMAAFKLDTRDAGKVLDTLTRTGQKYGGNVGNLTKQLTANAAAFDEMGLSIYGAIDFMGRLQVAGADADVVLGGLKRALKNATDDGIPLKQALADLEDQIKNGTDSTDGLATAFDLFGRNGSAVFKAVQNGQISFKDLADTTGVLADSVDALDETYDATLSGWDKMTVAANNLKIAGSELTGAFFEAASPVIDSFTGVVQGLTEKFRELPDEVQTVIGVIGGIGAVAVKVVPEIINFIAQLATLKVMRTLAGDSGALAGGLGKLKSGFSGLRGAAGYIGIAAGAVAGLALALEDANRAIEDSHKWTKEFKDRGQELLDEYEKERTAIQTVDEELAKLSTTEEKIAYLKSESTKATEAYNRAQEEYNRTLNASRNETKMTEEAEHSLWGEILYNGSSALYASEKAYESVTDKKLEYTKSTYQQIEQATAEKNRTEDVTAALESASEAMQKAQEDKSMLAQKSQEVIAQAAAEAEAVDVASHASISVIGEELTAWNNLSDGTKAAAENVVEAVNGMHENITAAVQSVGNFFEEIKAQEEQSAQDMYDNFQAQISAIQEWEQTLVDLADRGINQGLLQYLAEAGPEGQAYAKAMLDGIVNETGPGVDQWNQIFKDKLDLEAGINEEGQKLTTAVAEMAAGGEAAFREMANKLNASTTKTGGFIVDGIVQGIQNAQAEAEKAGNDLGTDTVDAVAAGAQVKSPSRATEATGKYIDQGLIRGMESMKGQAAAKGREIATGVITAINSTNTGEAAAKVGQDIGAKISAGITAQQAVAAAATAALIAGITRSLQQGTVQTYQAAVQMLRQITIGITSGAASGQSAAYNAGKGLVDSMASGLSSGSASAAAHALASSVSAAAQNVDKTAAWWAGYYLAHGLANGINSGSSAAVNAAAQMAQRAIDAAKRTLQIKSPSKVFKKIGEFTGAGYVRGITSMIKPAVKASKDFAAQSVKATKQAMLDLTKKSNATNYSQVARDLMSSLTTRTEANIKKQTTAVERQVKKYFQTYEYSLDKEQAKLQKKIDKLDRDDPQAKPLKKQLENLKKYSDQFKKIQNQLSTNISRELSDALNKSTAKVTDNLSKRVTRYAEQMQAAMSKVNQSIATMRDKLAGYGDLFTTKRGIWGDETMVSNLKDQIKTIRKYRDNLNALKGKVSESLMAEITSMSVDDAIKYTTELRSMSKSELKKYNDLYNQKIKLAKNISKNFYAEEVAAIKKDYTDKVTKAFNDANKKIKNLGTQAIKGFIAGMKSVDVDVDVQKQANAIIKAFKKALKIKSPSRVFEEEIGEPSGQGALKGFYEGMSPDASRIVGSVSMGLPDMAQYQAQAPQVYVYVGDRELSAVLSSSVIKQISGGERAYAAAGGRR